MGKKSKENKTNVMRILDKAKISYEARSYEDTDVEDSHYYGATVARSLGEDPKIGRAHV